MRIFFKFGSLENNFAVDVFKQLLYDNREQVLFAVLESEAGLKELNDIMQKWAQENKTKIENEFSQEIKDLITSIQQKLHKKKEKFSNSEPQVLEDTAANEETQKSSFFPENQMVIDDEELDKVFQDIDDEFSENELFFLSESINFFQCSTKQQLPSNISINLSQKDISISFDFEMGSLSLNWKQLNIEKTTQDEEYLENPEEVHCSAVGNWEEELNEDEDQEKDDYCDNSEFRNIQKQSSELKSSQFSSQKFRGMFCKEHKLPKTHYCLQCKKFLCQIEVEQPESPNACGWLHEDTVVEVTTHLKQVESEIENIKSKFYAIKQANSQQIGLMSSDYSNLEKKRVENEQNLCNIQETLKKIRKYLSNFGKYPSIFKQISKAESIFEKSEALSAKIDLHLQNSQETDTEMKEKPQEEPKISKIPQVVELEADISVLKDNLDATKAIISQYRSETSSILSKSQELSEYDLKLNNEMKNFKLQSMGINQTFSVTQLQVHSLRNEKKGLTVRLAEMQNQIQALAARNESLEEENKDLAARNENLTFEGCDLQFKKKDVMIKQIQYDHLIQNLNMERDELCNKK